jgi:peroxiredoxin
MVSAMDERELLTLPADIPVPTDDGAADQLVGVALPPIGLVATDGRVIRLDQTAVKRAVVYCFPRTGRPGESPLTPDWDRIPGARGCTPESCGFRDRHSELEALDVDVFGLSTQDPDYQREAVERLRLPFAFLSDQELELTKALRLPTFEVAGVTLLKRLTMVVRDGRIEHVWYPVFPPDRHAAEVVDWLTAHPAQ